jgi:hypothetical protein
MAERKLGSKTSPGFGNPEGAVRASDAEAARAEELAPPPAPRRSIAPRERVRAEGSGRPARAQRLLEVEIVQERGRTPRPDPLKRSFEVWTQNTVYVLDARLRCIEVFLPGSHEPKTDHPFFGARLVGGQLQLEGSVELSYPFPRPGSFAVFESRRGNRRQFSRTSTVERVVVRQRIVTLIGPSEPTWDDVALPDEADED